MAKTPRERIDYIIQWRKDHPEKVKEYQKKSDEKHKEARQEYRKNYVEQNKEKLQIQRKQYKKENREKLSKQYLDYLNSNPEMKRRQRERTKIWRTKNKEWLKEYSKSKTVLYQTDESHRKKVLDLSHDNHVNKRFEVIYWYSDGLMCCKECGENHVEFLAIDHINGGGTQERKKVNDIVFYLIRNNFPEGYQVLCHNCNTIKHINTIVRKNPDAPYNRCRDNIKNKMFKKYSQSEIPICKCCGYTDMRALTFNHINGGGTQERKTKKYTSMPEHLYRNNIPLSEINVLCQNCNKSLGHYGECPHNT